MAFNINAQVILSGPKNIKAVTKRIKSELSGVTVPVNIKIDKNISKNLGAFNRGVKDLTANLNTLSGAASKSDASIRKLTSGLQTLNRTNTSTVTSNKQVAASAGKTAEAFKEAGSELQTFGKDAALAIRRFTAFTVATSVVFGFVRAIGKATGAAIDYEREVTKLVQVTGASARKIGQFKKTIDDLSVSLGIDANELASLGRVFAQTGQSIDQVRSSLRAVARSSLAPSFGEMKSTAEGLIAAMAQFNIQANKSESVLGALNAVSKRFAVEAEDLISVIRRAGGVFSTAAGQMKDPQEALNELIGIFTAVRSTTRESADTIATGLRTIFTRIQRGRTIEFLKQFNIQLLDAKGQFVGLFPAFQKLSAGLRSLVQSGDAVKLSAITEELGGIRQVGKLIPAIVNFNKALAATKVAAKGAAEGLGKDVGLALTPLGKQFEQVASRFNTLIRTISESKTFQNLAKVALSTANAFLSVAEALTPLIPLITTLATIKISRGLFEFGQGFIGGLRKGGGPKGVGGALGSVATGGDRGSRGAAAARSASAGEKAVAQALRNNVQAVRQSTVASKSLQSTMTQSSLKLSSSVTSLVSSNTSLIAAIGNLTLAIGRSGGGIGGIRSGFRPRKFARGGVVRGPSHAQGGVLAELEGGETVLPRGYQFGPRRGTRGVAPLSFRERLLFTQGSASARGQVRRIARLRDDQKFSGLTEQAGVGAVGMRGGELTGKQATTARKNLLKKLQAGANDKNDSYGGAFLTSPSGLPASNLTGRLDPAAILKELNKFGAWKSLSGARGLKEGSAARKLKSDIQALAKQKSDFNFVAGVLSESRGAEIEASILEGVEAAVTTGASQLARFVGSKSTTRRGSRELGQILRSANIDNVIGNLFEAIISAAGVPYSIKDNDAANAPFDFPRGLGAKSAAFQKSQLASIPTDAKTRYTKDNIQSFLKKIKNFEAAGLERYLADALTGSSAAAILADVPEKARRGIKTGLSSRAKGIEDKRRRALAAQALLDEPVRRAAGGPIFSPRGTDTVPAMLTPGEYVINRSSAQAIGYGKLDNLNRLAKGGKVRYYKGGSPGGVSGGKRAAGSSGGGAADTVDTFTDSVANSIIAVTGLTAAVSGLSFNSMEELVASAGSLALAFAQLQFFLGADTFRNLAGIAGKGGVLSGALSGLPGAGAFGAAKSAFGQTPLVGRTGFQAVKSKGFLGITQTAAKPLTGFAKGLAKSKAGLSAFMKGIGGFTGFFKGLPGLITSLLIAPITNFAVDKFLGGKIEEIAGVRGRRGVSAGAVGVASTVGGAVKGAATGAAIGSIVLGPGFGTALGFVLGGALQGVAEGAEAQRQQELFNAFSRLTDASTALSDTFDKIEKSGGALNAAQQRRAERELRSANIERREVIELLSNTAKGTVTFTAAINRANSAQNISGRFGLPGERRPDERSAAMLQAVRPNKGLFSFDRGTGTTLKLLDSLNKFFEENTQVIERQRKATSLNIESLFKNIESSVLTTAISGIGALDEGPDRILRGTGKFRGQSAGMRVGRTAEAIASNQGDLLSSRTSRSFNDIRKNLNQLANANDKGARSLRAVLDDQFFLEFTEQFRKQANNLRKAGDPAASRLRALFEGFTRLQQPLAEISRVEDLDKLLNNLQKELMGLEGTTRDEALEIIRLVRGVQAVTVERFQELNAVKQLNLLQKQANQSLQDFSQRLKEFRETTANASTDFGVFINNVQADLSGILGDRIGRKNLSGRFTGVDRQITQLEAGGPRADRIRNLTAVQRQLPNIIREVITRLRQEGGGQPEDVVRKSVRDAVSERFGGNVEPAVLDQISLGVGEALKRQGTVVADALDGLEKALNEDADAIAKFSPLLNDVNSALKEAFASLVGITKNFSTSLQAQTRVLDQNIQRRIQIRQREESLSDRLRGIRGGRGSATRLEARRRRNQQIGEILGFGGAAGLPSLRRGPGAGIGAVGRDLLSRRATLGRAREAIDRRRAGAVTPRQRSKAERELERNTSALSRTNRALASLANDTTELSAIMQDLESAVSRQAAAEQNIRTFAELAQAIASGSISSEEVNERFGIPLRAFQKLEKATLAGDPRTANLSFKELLALQSPPAILVPLFDDLAKKITAPGGIRAGQDPQQVLKTVIQEMTGGLGQVTESFFSRIGRPDLARGVRRNIDAQQGAILAREGGAAEATDLLRFQRGFIEALNLSDQEIAAQTMREATQQFEASVRTFAVAMQRLETIRQLPARAPAGRRIGDPIPGPRVIPEMKSGGFVKGRSHAQGGELRRLEGGEYVIPKAAMKAGGAVGGPPAPPLPTSFTGGAVGTRNENIRKRNEQLNKERKARGMKPFQIGPNGRFVHGGGRLLYEGEKAPAPSKAIPKRVIEPGSRPIEMAPLGGTRPAGSGLSDLVGPVSRGGGTAYSSKYGGLRRRPIFAQRRRSGYSRINMGPNPGAVGARRRRSSKPWTWEQAGAGVTAASIRQRRHVASLDRIHEREGQPSSRQGALNLRTGRQHPGPPGMPLPGFGPSLRGMMARLELRQIADATRPPVTSAVKWRRHVAALERKAIKGDKAALKELMEIAARARARRKKGVQFRQGGGLIHQIPEIGAAPSRAQEGMLPILQNTMRKIDGQREIVSMQHKLFEAFGLGPDESMIGRALLDTDKFDPGFQHRFESQKKLEEQRSRNQELIERMERQIREIDRLLGIPHAPPLPRSFKGTYKKNGGSIFKPKGTDTVPAMLTPGEFVIRRDAVNAVGVDTLQRINSMRGGGRSLSRGGVVYAQGGRLIDDDPRRALDLTPPRRRPTRRRGPGPVGRGGAPSLITPATSPPPPPGSRNLPRFDPNAGHTHKELQDHANILRANGLPYEHLAPPHHIFRDDRGSLVLMKGTTMERLGLIGTPPHPADYFTGGPRVARQRTPALGQPSVSGATVGRTAASRPARPGHPSLPLGKTGIGTQVPGAKEATPAGNIFRLPTSAPPERRGPVRTRAGLRTIAGGPAQTEADIKVERGLRRRGARAAGRPGDFDSVLSPQQLADFVAEQKRRTALVNKLGPEGLRFLQSRIPLGSTVPDDVSPDLWKALGNKVARISSWDVISAEKFENLYVQALEYTQGQDAKRKALGYGLGPAFADRHKNATPAERAEFDNQQIAATKHQKRRAFLETVLRRWLPETGLLGKRGAGTGTYDEEKRIPKNPDELIRDWVLKWGNGDLNRAIENRRAHDDKLADEKFKGKEIKGIEAGARPGLFSRNISGKGPLIKGRSERGRKRFGVTGSRFRGAGTTAFDHLQAAGTVDPSTGIKKGRFEKIASQRAAKARVEAKKAKARTAKLRKSQRKMTAKQQLEERRKAAGLPPGATKDDIFSAETSAEFLKKAKSGDPEQWEKLRLGHLDEKTGEFQFALLRVSESMKAEANSPLYPGFTPQHKKGQRPKRPQGKAASGGPFIDYMKLPGPGEVTQEMWDAMVGVKKADTAMKDQLDSSLEDISPGGTSSGMADDILRELNTEQTSARNARYVDAFGKPGGPGYYVEKAAWQIAYAEADLKRQKRDRFRTQKGTGKTIKIGGKQDVASGAPSIRGPRKLTPGTPAHARATERRRKGMAKARARNAKRLAGVQKIRLKRGLEPLKNEELNEFGVPLIGWKAATGWMSEEAKKWEAGFDHWDRAHSTGNVNEKNRGGVVYAQGGGLFRQIPEISGGFVRGAKTTVGERQKRLNYPFGGKAYNKGQLAQKRKAASVWKRLEIRRKRQIDAGRDSWQIGPIGMARTSRVKEWMSQVGSSMKSYLSGETPAQKTGRLGLGHSSGYGGMKDPRWGMGGADYMYTKERGKGFHGYQQGGQVIQRGRQWDNTQPLRNPPTLRGRQRYKRGPFLPSPTGIFSAMGNIMRRKWGMESPAEKTGRLGFGHTTGYGGMKDPRWGMGGADYMYTKERGKGFHGYNRGGNVDSVPAMLTPGEFVMRRESVRKYGDRFMNDINLQKFNNGGPTGGPAAGRSNVSQSKDLERGAALAGESILNAFTKGSQMVGDAIRAALSPENLAAQLGDVVAQKMQESLAATSIDLKGNMGVDVRLSGNGAAGDMTAKVQDSIKNAIAGALTNRTNVDGSAKDPSLHSNNV